MGTYAYVNPVVAVLVGYFLGGEALGLRTILGTSIRFDQRGGDHHHEEKGPGNGDPRRAHAAGLGIVNRNLPKGLSPANP